MMKETIRLRQKATADKNGVMSLYLDIYRNGKREYEFLKLYLVPELTKATGIPACTTCESTRRETTLRSLR